jgi:hypothetical protein
MINSTSLNEAHYVTPTYDCYEDDEVPPSKMPDIDDIVEEHDVDTYDQYFGAHVRVPIGDEIRYGKVLCRKCELYGTVRGQLMKLSFQMGAVMNTPPM